MQALSLIPEYLAWHYTKGIKSIFDIWKNVEVFIFNFFSVPLLLKTFFSPFERLGEGYKRGLDVGGIVGTFIVNTIMRLVGMVARLFLIILSVVAALVWLVFGIALILFWVLLPFIIVDLLYIFIHRIL